MSKLKSCPFCGGKAKIGKPLFDTSKRWVYCGSCYIGTDIDKKAHAIKLWNTRVEPSWCERGLAIVMHEAGGGGSNRSHLKQQLKDELLAAYRKFDHSLSNVMPSIWTYEIDALEAKLKEANEPKPQNK